MEQPDIDNPDSSYVRVQMWFDTFNAYLRHRTDNPHTLAFAADVATRVHGFTPSIYHGPIHDKVK